jgi:hypothetical protein
MSSGRRSSAALRQPVQAVQITFDQLGETSAGDDHRDQHEEEPGPRAQHDQRCDGAGRRQSMLAFCSVVAVLLRGLGDVSLHLKAWSKAGPAARQQPDGTGKPASPSAPGQRWPTASRRMPHAAVRR